MDTAFLPLPTPACASWPRGRRERGSPHPLHLSLAKEFSHSLTKNTTIMEKYEIDRLRSLPIEDAAERLGLHATRH